MAQEAFIAAAAAEPAAPRANRFKLSRKRQMRTALYYATPIVVIAVLFITHRIISHRNANVLKNSKIFDQWKVKNGTRNYYLFESNESGEVGPFRFNFQVEKINVELTDGMQAKFDYFRKWSVDSDTSDELSETSTFKKHQNLFPNTEKDEFLGHFTVSSHSSSLNKLIGAKLNATLGDYFYNQLDFKPIYILLPDFKIFLNHNQITLNPKNEEQTIATAELTVNQTVTIKSELIIENSRVKERKTAVKIQPLLRYEDNWLL